MTKSSVIKVDGLVSAYGDDVILDRISFEIREGERFVILGGSGCGKSTLLKHLIGLLRPLEGSINILGEEIGGSDEGAFQAVLRQIGVLFQG
ncbi:MAG: ATP-binding cassette domain-containing protein, partial [Desulfobulbaceae bacterium]|nr:ATP-binding cassette domain-containing protein [Desulfobulbaceae bacterium]